MTNRRPHQRPSKHVAGFWFTFRKLAPTLLRGNAVFDARRCPKAKARHAERPGRRSHGDRGSESDVPGFDIKRILRQPLTASTTHRLRSPSLLIAAPSCRGPVRPAIPRHPPFTDSFASQKLASFFAQLQVTIDISLDRPSFCVFRVWLRCLLFLFTARVFNPSCMARLAFRRSRN